MIIAVVVMSRRWMLKTRALVLYVEVSAQPRQGNEQTGGNTKGKKQEMTRRTRRSKERLDASVRA